MVKLRLQRYGTKKRPFYRVVAADSKCPRDGRFIEQLGTYNSISFSGDLELKTERIEYWLKQGAQPTDTVRNLLKKQGLLAGAKA